VELVGGGGYYNRCKIVYEDGSKNKEYDQGYLNNPYNPANGGWLHGGAVDVYTIPGTAWEQ
jgi:hypothetical protein